MDYQYPISLDWDTQEVIDVISFFQCVEKAYENGVDKAELMDTYHRFKLIIPSKSEEKQICNEFEKSTGYSPYRAVKKAKEADSSSKIKM